MSSPYLEIAAQAEQELAEALDELAGVIRQRDELQKQLTIAIEEISKLNKKLKPKS